MAVHAAAALSKKSHYIIGENNVVETILTLDPKTYYCTVAGQVIPDFRRVCRELPADTTFQLHFRLLGGKGGFGSLLRSFRVNKSTNQLMCRDLNGRRLASIDEEKKLKRWIERAAEREKEKIAKRNAKYEKLKSGPPRHMFNDPDYIRQKETIIEKTEEAFEQGFVEYLKEEQEKKTKPIVESSSDSDFDIDDLPGGLKTNRKRKAARKAPEFTEKLPKLEEEEEDGSDSDDENDVDPELLNEIKQYFSARDAKLASAEVDAPCSSKTNDDLVNEIDVSQEREEKASIDSTKYPTEEDGTAAETSPVIPMEENSAVVTSPDKEAEGKVADVSGKETTPEELHRKKKNNVSNPEEPEEFAEVDLSKYKNPTELEALGLQHLKHALKARGMKCGGTLSERAARLYSAKQPDL